MCSEGVRRPGQARLPPNISSCMELIKSVASVSSTVSAARPHEHDNQRNFGAARRSACTRTRND